MFGTGARPPKGWSIAFGRLEEEPTVRAYLARGCEVHGRCHRRDCRRTCHFDFEQLISDGMATLPVREVQRTLQCNRLGGCGLVFEEKPAFPLTLGELTGRDYVGVEIRCAGCRRIHITSVEGMILRLQASGQGGKESLIKGLGKLIRGPCGKCRATRWEVAVLWYDPNAGKVPPWKQELQKRRDTARRLRSERPGPPP
jgi:hypothetical protein